ncbi:MAG: ABC transporter permease [Firmicutes bacterium]|nr:ABC transporter permease [Bacillota bacterium]
MNWLQGIPLAWEGIKSNKLRSFLTMLGIIIGVGAVISLVSVAQGASSRITAQLENLGTNLILITPFRGTDLTEQDAAELMERVSSLRQAAPILGLASSSLQAGGNEYEPLMPGQGVTPEYAEVRDFKVAVGRFIRKEDLETRAKVAVIGRKVADGLFNLPYPIGQEFWLDGHPMLVVGILESKGASMGQDYDDMVFIPLSTAQRFNRSATVSTIYAQARNKDVAELAVNHITAIYQVKSRRTGGQLPIRVTSQDQLLSTLSTTTQTLSLMLGAIAGISLLVGGIGIMNIMLVSVTERTREIGIRKAIGAKKRFILAQFLVESIVISLTGGLLGIMLGVGGSMLIGRFSVLPVAVSLPAVAVSFTFAALIGLFFGVYPAMKAANLDPIEALRYQ